TCSSNRDIGPGLLVSEQRLIGFRDVLDGPGKPAGVGPESWATQKRSGSPRQWTPIEEQRLLNLAGCKNVRFIAERLHRSVAAVRKRVRRWGETSTRVREGLTKNQLAELIGSSPKTIQRWIDLGWLHGGYEGKNRDDDSIRISDKQFFEFWRNHPEQVLIHRWNREALEWLVLLLCGMGRWKTTQTQTGGARKGA